MTNISYETRQKIIVQALNEISFARIYKQSKTGNWKINEDLYYGRKIKSQDSRANVDLGQMSAFVHTILSKIDNKLTFKFTKRKESQTDRINKLNALKEIDGERDNWDIKDIAGKKQGVIYGRAIYSYYAESEKNEKYESHLDNIDVYDFLIDPSAGGIDIEKAFYLGDYGVVLTKKEIKEGIKNKIFLKTEAEKLLNGSGNSNESNQEETNKQNRTQANNITKINKEIGDVDKYKFWRWGTTFEGKRYFLLLSEDGGTAIEITELKEKFQSEMWWYWTWAAFIDLTEFWTPSYCDYVREVFMAQAISINQALDNNEAINKPQKIVNITAIENLAELKYRKDGIIRVKANFNADQAIQFVKTAPITTALNVFQTLDGIQEKASGVTAAAQGVAENNSGTKATIYEGNQAAVADRFGLLNKSYSFGYKRFANLWRNGVKEHLIKKQAIEILGPNGISVEMVSKRDLFRKDEEYGISVLSSDAELALSAGEKKIQLGFLQTQGGIKSNEPIQNAKKAYEIGATIAGFDTETIKELLDTENTGEVSVNSKVERDIERILDGEIIEPNEIATTFYKQKIVDYMYANKESMKEKDFENLLNYTRSLDPIITRNMEKQANEILFKKSMQEILNPTAPTAPVAPATPNLQEMPLMAS